jgi:hypothetical protein
MGVIVALLVASGDLSPDVRLSLTEYKTLWIILSCHLAMGLGTAFGGWRIVRTMGMKITKLRPVGGFCAETAGALTLFLATQGGVPVSTTHTITGSIVGVGATTRLSGIKWGIARRIVWVGCSRSPQLRWSPQSAFRSCASSVHRSSLEFSTFSQNEAADFGGIFERARRKNRRSSIATSRFFRGRKPKSPKKRRFALRKSAELEASF